MNNSASKRTRVLAVGLGAVLLGFTVHAAVSEVIAVGNMAHSDLFVGPATVTMRRLTIAPGEVLGWHHHPGVGAYTIVESGMLVVEDGCGGETVYTAGEAFLEPPNRVHRGKNLTAEEVETVQTFIVPTGSPTSVSTPQLCGVAVPTVTISPASGTYTTTQRFDPVLVLNAPGRVVSSGRAFFDGVDVTSFLASCLIPGTGDAGEVVFRCPGAGGSAVGPGSHTLEVTLELSDGSSVRSAVAWNVIAVAEP